MASAVYDATAIDIEAGTCRFRATGQILKFDGFIRVYTEGRDDAAPAGSDEDDAEGQLLTATLMDYAVPRADTLPPFGHALVPVPSPNNALGIKGFGELPTNGAPAAVANAVADALAADGVAHVELPMTPQRVWAALESARGTQVEGRRGVGAPFPPR